MQPKGLFLAAVLGVALVAPAGGAADQASNQTESVGTNQSETAKHEAVKSAINNIRAAIEEMKEQEEILNELVAEEAAPRAAYTKFKGEGAPVRAKAETAETKEGGTSSTIHKMPGRTKAAEGSDPEGVAPGQRTTASRAECSNTLKQLSLDIERDYNKLHRFFRGTKHKSFLLQVKELQAGVQRVRAALKKLPAEPDEKADGAALREIAAGIEQAEAAVDELGRIKVQF